MVRKKIIGLVLVALMIGFVGTSVSAHDTDDVAAVSEITPRGAICPDCEEGELKYFSITEEPTLVYKYPCSHFNYGYDYNYKVETVTWWECNSCPYASDFHVTTSYTTDCQGHE